MTLRRRRNGRARNRGWSLGSVFWTWSAASVREISSWSSIARMQVDPCIKKDVLRKIWLNWVWDGMLGLSNNMIQWTVLCWSYTIVELSACKTRGHTRTFHKKYDSLTRTASQLLFITTITVGHWILDAAWRASIQGWENTGSQAIMRKKMILCVHKMEFEKPFSCIGQSTSDEKWDIINDWDYQIDMLLPKLSRHYVGIFSTNEQQKVLLAAKTIEMHDPTLS
jgi:hypothetical protein